MNGCDTGTWGTDFISSTLFEPTFQAATAYRHVEAIPSSGPLKIPLPGNLESSEIIITLLARPNARRAAASVLRWLTLEMLLPPPCIFHQ